MRHWHTVYNMKLPALQSPAANCITTIRKIASTSRKKHHSFRYSRIKAMLANVEVACMFEKSKDEYIFPKYVDNAAEPRRSAHIVQEYNKTTNSSTFSARRYAPVPNLEKWKGNWKDWCKTAKMGDILQYWLHSLAAVGLHVQEKRCPWNKHC